jgi:Fe-Mn family superoxide dismutase
LNLTPPSSENKGNGGVLKDGPLKDAINESFGGLDKMRREFNKMVCEMHGVGWGWVVSLVTLRLGIQLISVALGFEPDHQAFGVGY